MKPDDRFRLLFEQTPQPMWLFDEETLRFVEVNEAAIATYGYTREEFLRMDLTQIRAPEDVPELREAIRRGPSGPNGSSRTHKHLTKDGQSIDVEVVSNRLVLDGRTVRLAAIRDVSERKALEEQLRQSQKIETVGQLAGGIAHDFNNLLMAILGHAELLAEYFTDGDPRADDIKGIRNAADAAVTLTRQLMAFSRKQLLQPRVLDLNDVLDKTHGMLGRLIGEHIDLATFPGESLRLVRVDGGQLEQLLLNLVVNARDAMPDGGRLTVRTQNVTVDAALGKRRSVKPGDFVELSVMDTGVGIDPTVRVHLFEPFFTTKDPSRGTGLGLSTVYGIVRQSGGHIVVDSAVGQGTTFSIYLPATSASHASDSGPDAQPVADGTETVLLVEEDAGVRGLVADVLRRRGYTVLVAEHAAEALEIADRAPETIHLLLTDIVLSGMTGFAVAERVRARRADTKVLYLSGYTDVDVSTAGFTEVVGAFLHKPFTPDALARLVRGTLDS